MNIYFVSLFIIILILIFIRKYNIYEIEKFSTRILSQ